MSQNKTLRDEYEDWFNKESNGDVGWHEDCADFFISKMRERIEMERTSEVCDCNKGLLDDLLDYLK